MSQGQVRDALMHLCSKHKCQYTCTTTQGRTVIYVEPVDELTGSDIRNDVLFMATSYGLLDVIGFTTPNFNPTKRLATAVYLKAASESSLPSYVIKNQFPTEFDIVYQERVAKLEIIQPAPKSSSINVRLENKIPVIGNKLKLCFDSSDIQGPAAIAPFFVSKKLLKSRGGLTYLVGSVASALGINPFQLKSMTVVKKGGSRATIDDSTLQDLRRNSSGVPVVSLSSKEFSFSVITTKGTELLNTSLYHHHLDAAVKV